MNWHLITGEYPPQPGGVSDHTFLLAHALGDAGHSVSIWCPPAEGPTPSDGRVVVRRELGTIGAADLRRVGTLLDAEPVPRRLLIQWVPHAFGPRAINYGFCRWVRRRKTRHGDRVEVLVHEPFLGVTGTWKQRAAAVVQRLMMRKLLQDAVRAWVTIPTWAELIRPYAPAGLPIDLLPVPSTIPVVDRPAEAAAVRARFLGGAEFLVGHFGTYGGHVAGDLRVALLRLLATEPRVSVLLLGRHGDRFRDEIVREHPQAAGRVAAPGGLSAEELSAHLAACDLFVQPYSGGISSRNTSLMACLAHGKPAVATSGRLTEPFWSKSGAVVLTPERDAESMVSMVSRLLSDREARARLSAAALEMYEERFSLARVVGRLTGPELVATA